MLLRFLVRSMLAAETAVLAEFKLLWSCLLVFSCCVISLLTLSASKSDDISHLFNPFTKG
jgi:hypothetical protein